MNYLFRQLPEYQRGRHLLSSCKWKPAIAEFSRTAEIMMHANQSVEHAIANLYVGVSALYLGESNKASDMFLASLDRLSANGSRHANVAARFRLSSEMESKNVIKDDYSAWGKDPQISLGLNERPSDESSSEYGLWMSHKDDLTKLGKLLEDVNSPMDLISASYMVLNRLESVILSLPPFNTDEVSVNTEIDLITELLKSGEKLSTQSHGEIRLIGNWIIGRALLLRGRLFQFNTNALMAEAMYNASIEKVTGEEMTLPRFTTLRRRGNRELGALLLNWERRENEGKKLLDAYSEEANDLCFKQVIPTITFQELDNLYP